jgi:hypothetical protein
MNLATATKPPRRPLTRCSRLKSRDKQTDKLTMKLYHFTSQRHLYGIGRFGLTVGDVPTDIRLNKGRCGVWLTSDSNARGHGLEGSGADKSEIRLTVSVPENAALVRWIDWAPKNVTPQTIRLLHEIGSAFETWWVYFGVIDRAAIEACVNMRTGKIIEGWSETPQAGWDVEPVPPWRRTAWHKKLLKSVARTAAGGRSR